MDEHDDIRSLLTQAAGDVPAVAPDAGRVLRRARRRAIGTLATGAIAIVAAAVVGAPAIREMLREQPPRILPAITGLDDGAYLVDLTTGRATRLEGLPSDAVEFDAAPGGEQIAFVSARDGSAQIYVMDLDGTGLRRLSDDPFGVAAPEWSPDGTRIAYTGFEDQTIRNVFVLELATGEMRQVTDGRDDVARPTWTRDGRGILYLATSHKPSVSGPGWNFLSVRKVDLASSRDRRVIGGPAMSIAGVDVASDGRIFIAGNVGDDVTLFDIRVLDPGGRAPGTLVYAGPQDDLDLEASPDATKVAFTSSIHDGDLPAVRVVDLQGRSLIGPIHLGHSPTWLSDDVLLVDVGCQEHASAGCPSA